MCLILGTMNVQLILVFWTEVDSAWMSWCRQTQCAPISYQPTLDQFHTVILSGMSVIHPADGDLRDKSYYFAGRHSGSTPSSPARTLPARLKDQFTSQESRPLIAVWALHFNEKETSEGPRSQKVICLLRWHIMYSKHPAPQPWSHVTFNLLIQGKQQIWGQWRQMRKSFGL